MFAPVNRPRRTAALPTVDVCRGRLDEKFPSSANRRFPLESTVDTEPREKEENSLREIHTCPSDVGGAGVVIPWCWSSQASPPSA